MTSENSTAGEVSEFRTDRFGKLERLREVTHWRNMGFMATRGVYIMDGYIPNRGMFRVYQDLDNPNFLFCEAKNYDLSLYVSRERVQPRRAKANPKINTAIHSKVNADPVAVSCPEIDKDTVPNTSATAAPSDVTTWSEGCQQDSLF